MKGKRKEGGKREKKINLGKKYDRILSGGKNIFSPNLYGTYLLEGKHIILKRWGGGI